jgi:TetR/AcrR family transcriptional regulator, fatty acid metabolism regulator protein
MSQSSAGARRAPAKPRRVPERGGQATRGDKRERILDAAVRVFARKGFHATRVSEVAKAAGVADGTIYLYFDSKDQLLVSLFEHRVERLLAYLETELPRAPSASHRLQRIIELQLGLLEGERDLAEVVTVIFRQSAKLMREHAAPMFNAYLDAIARVIAEGQASGELRDDVTPHVAARAVFGALDGITMTWAMGKAEHGGLLRVSGQLVEIILRGLTPGGALVTGRRP